MKTKICLLHLILIYLAPAGSEAQLCNNPADSVYGLNSITATGLAGQIAGVNVNTSGVTPIGSPAAAGNNANGLGFSQLNGLFYFFNQCGSGVTEFISYNPVTGTKLVKAAPPATILPAHKIRSGSCNNGGNGYYTINPNAAVPYLYYYNIALNTWTTITSTFLNSSGTVVTDFKTLNSGDMTFDGKGNLWILCSGTSVTSKYSLFEIKAPVPTTAVASILVDTIISITNTPGGVNFTGTAFNSKGKLYLTTGSGVGVGNNQLYEMTTPGVLTLKGSVPDGYGDDLASCFYPVGVLGVKWLDFIVADNHPKVDLEWKVYSNGNTSHYQVDYSNDAQKWRTVGTVPANGLKGYAHYKYSYSGSESGDLYFRIGEISLNGEICYSETKKINRSVSSDIAVYYDHAKHILSFRGQDDQAKYYAAIYDMNGRLLVSATLEPGQESMDISRLQKGFLFVRIESQNKKFLKTYKLMTE